ncbi:MAG TPA: discoidin domain-containing protein [Polyangia bacterium]|nr:discoidin domain-containing protein [Polyangia bacterium]
MLCAASGSAQAATVVWGGGDGTFATAANWVGGSAPGSSDTVSFGGWAPLDRAGWTVSASVNSSSAGNAVDGRRSTIWTTGSQQTAGQNFIINMGSAQTFRALTLDPTGNATEAPRNFTVYTSSDGSAWIPAASGGASSGAVTVTLGSAVTRQYIKLQLNLGATGVNWSIGELTVYGTAGETELSRNGWTASASASGSGTGASNAIDGNVGTRWNPGSTQSSTQWFSVDMGAAQTFTRIDLDAYSQTGEYPRGYDVYVSSDGSSWGSSIASGSGAAELTSISFPAQTKRYLKIQLNTTTSSNSWSIVELKVYGTPAGCNLAANVSVAALSLDKAITVTQASGITLTLTGGYSQSAGTFTGGDAAISVASFSLTGGSFTNSTGGLTASGSFATSSGTTFTSTSGNVTCSSTSSPATIGGSYSAGTGTHTFSGGLSVSGTGALTMAAAGKLAIGAGTTLAMDGTLTASNTSATIQSAGGAGTSYTFKVGSTATATPTLNISGLKVKNTDSNGLWINANSAASTTFTRFDNIAFSNGTGSYLLQITAASLYLTSSGCSFDAGSTASTTYAVGLSGNGTSDGETRALFGGATCASNVTSCQSAKSDDDSDNDGVGNSAGNGAVVQFLQAAETDMAGTLVGFPTAAFDWNTFSYYSTYVAYNSASGSKPAVYVRDGSGAAKYAWTGSSGETMVGTPRWITSGTTHYVYVAMSSGKVYRLVDNGSSSLTLDTGWTTNPYDCSCTIVTPLSMDASNLYWGGSQSGAQKIWTLGQSGETQPMGSPLAITPTITSAAPLLWSNAGTTSLFLGTAGHLLQVNLSNQTLAGDNSNPGSASIWGRIVMGTNGTNRVLAGDDGGTFWSMDPASFGGTTKQWSYAVSGDSIKSSPYYDYTTDTVMFGTEGGQIVALTGAGAAMTGYPYRPGTSSDAVESAPLYCNGVLAVGTTTGKLFFLDRNNGTTGPALIRAYAFGSTESVSGIAVDPSTYRYMVTTSDASAKDGRLYYFDVISDPTPASL